MAKKIKFRCTTVLEVELDPDTFAPEHRTPEGMIAVLTAEIREDPYVMFDERTQVKVEIVR